MCLNCIILEEEKFTSCKTFSENPLVASVCTVLYLKIVEMIYLAESEIILCAPQS